MTDAAPVPSVEPANPAPRLTVRVDNAERELFMSYNMLRQVTAAVPKAASLEEVMGAFLSPEYADTILETVLAERDAKGKIVAKVSLDDVLVEMEAVEQILLWVQQHIANFTLGRLESLTKVKAAVEPKAKSLEQSLTGSVA